MTPIPVLALPGLLNDSHVWAHQIAALGGDYQVIVANLTEGNTIQSLAEKALKAVPSERFSLAGFSMGGYVALEIMRVAPHRVAALALLDTSARPDTPESREVRQKSIAMAADDFNGLVQGLLPRLIHPARRSDLPLIDSIVNMARRVGRDAFVRQQQAIMTRTDSRPTIGKIHCPTLVLCGSNDLVTPVEFSEELTSLITDARLSVIEECGHMSLLEKPNEVNAALRSLLSRTRA